MECKITRREFAKKTALVCGVGAVIIGGKTFGAKLLPEEKFLRLPGSADEKKFLSTCIKCGQCVQVCAYHSVKLLDINKFAAIGTPVIIPEERGCYLCDLLPCVLSCPSGALDHNVSDQTQVMMGKAVVRSPKSCFGMTGQVLTEDQLNRLIAHGVTSDVEKELAAKLIKYVGKPCTLCRDLCPYREKDMAIILTGGEKYSPEIKEKCVGCGVCVELCPATEKVLYIEPFGR